MRIALDSARLLPALAAELFFLVALAQQTVKSEKQHRAPRMAAIVAASDKKPKIQTSHSRSAIAVGPHRGGSTASLPSLPPVSSPFFSEGGTRRLPYSLLDSPPNAPSAKSMDSLPTPPFPSQPSPLFSPLAAVDKSIETQVSEARKRAQQYADAVRAAKEREAKSIQSLEAEKNKWIESYEKKSMLVNQLERELSSAVEMIESQRRSSSVDALGGTTVPLLSDATIHENLKKLLALSTSRQSGDRDASRNAASGDSSHALLGHSVDASRLEHSSHALDRGRAFDQLAEMQDQISALTDEVTQLKLSRDDLSGKLQFRMNQVRAETS